MISDLPTDLKKQDRVNKKEYSLINPGAAKKGRNEILTHPNKQYKTILWGFN